MSDAWDMASDAVTDTADAVGGALGLKTPEGEKVGKQDRALALNTPLPDLRDIKFSKYKEILQDPTEYGKISEDAQLRDAQLRSLNNLDEIAAGEGLTDADRARLQIIARDEAIRERGQRESVIQNAQARGVSGSGLELASLLNAQAAGADRTAMRDLGVEDMAERRALAAIEARGNLAGNIRGQDYGVSADRAKAQDIINAFNTQNRIGVNQGNVALTNQQKMINKLQNPQQQYENKLNRLRVAQGGTAGLASAEAGRYNRLLSTVGAAAEAFAPGSKKKIESMGPTQ